MLATSSGETMQVSTRGGLNRYTSVSSSVVKATTRSDSRKPSNSSYRIACESAPLTMFPSGKNCGLATDKMGGFNSDASWQRKRS